jgi:hypothetical protein
MSFGFQPDLILPRFFYSMQTDLAAPAQATKLALAVWLFSHVNELISPS